MATGLGGKYQTKDKHSICPCGTGQESSVFGGIGVTSWSVGRLVGTAPNKNHRLFLGIFRGRKGEKHTRQKSRAKDEFKETRQSQSGGRTGGGVEHLKLGPSLKGTGEDKRE